MKKIVFFFLIVFGLFPFLTKGQNTSCAGAFPLCLATDSSFFISPASTNAGNAEIGPDYGCLYTQPNPAWFFVVVTDSGDIELQLSGSGNCDIDFACWGPFTQPVTPCNGQLDSNTIVNCSYSVYPVELCYIQNALVGEVYILLITNYANVAGNLMIQQSNMADSNGTIACFPTIDSVSSNSPVCQTDTLFLRAPTIDSATYSWTGPNGFSSFDQNPVLPNIQMGQEGPYNLIITQDSVDVYAYLFIDIKPWPFSVFNTSPVSGGVLYNIWQASDSNIMFYGDGEFQEDLLLNTWYEHQYDSAGVYNVMLISFNECGSDTMIKVVNPDFSGIIANPDIHLNLFPNPTTGKCVIEGMSVKDITLVECRSVDGRLIYSGLPTGRVDGTNSVADLTDCIPGIYILKINTSGNTYYAKIIRSPDR